jgi:hypothetical protein
MALFALFAIRENLHWQTLITIRLITPMPIHHRMTNWLGYQQ